MNLERLLPTITPALINKILLLEIYFLFRVGSSPSYFGLIDFFDTYAIEILYISITLALLSQWIIFPLFILYGFVIHLMSTALRWCFGFIKFNGVPVFAALKKEEKDKSVSIEVTLLYAKSRQDEKLIGRIEKYDTDLKEKLSNEMLAATNLLLIIAIVLLQHWLGYSNFLQRVTDFVEPFANGFAYTICITLLLFQGLLGRVSSIHLFVNSGSLPPSFFNDEAEREAARNFSSEHVESFFPLAKKWMESTSE